MLNASTVPIAGHAAARKSLSFDSGFIERANRFLAHVSDCIDLPEMRLASGISFPLAGSRLSLFGSLFSGKPGIAFDRHLSRVVAKVDDWSVSRVVRFQRRTLDRARNAGAFCLHRRRRVIRDLRAPGARIHAVSSILPIQSVALQVAGCGRGNVSRS